MERLLKEQDEEHARQLAHEAQAREAAAQESAAAAAEERVRRVHERTTQCLMGRVDTEELQAFCRAHWAEEHTVGGNTEVWTRLRTDLEVANTHSHLAYCWATRRPEWTSTTLASHLTESVLKRIESARGFIHKVFGPRGFKPSVDLPEVFVAQCCVAFVSLASRPTPWPVTHRLRLLADHLEVDLRQGEVKAEARELLLTLEKLQRAKGLPPGVTHLILKSLFHVAPPRPWSIHGSVDLT